MACTEGFGLNLVPELMAAFHQLHPRIQFDLTVTSPAQVTAMVQNGDVEMGLCFSRVAHEDIQVELRRTSRVSMVARPDHPLAHRTQITLAELTRYPLALPARETSLRQLFDVACSLQGLVVKPILVCDNAWSLHRFVLSSGTASIASGFSVQDYVAQHQMVVVPIKDRRMGDRAIELQTLRGRLLPRVSQAFLTFVRQHLRESRL